MSGKNFKPKNVNQSAEDPQNHNTKQTILDTASKIMTQKGFLESSIVQ